MTTTLNNLGAVADNPRRTKMQRKSRLVAGVSGLAVAGLVAALGLVMSSNAQFAERYTTEQLAQQNITFSTLDRLTDEERESPCLVGYAGQRLTTGRQAECYANDFIGLHVKSVAGGKTYADLSGPERALQAKVAAAQKANDPGLADLQKQHAILKAQRDALFQGETSRGLLLTSFGFSVLGAKAAEAAAAAFIASGLLVLLSLVSLALMQRTPVAARATSLTTCRWSWWTSRRSVSEQAVEPSTVIPEATG